PFGNARARNSVSRASLKRSFRCLRSQTEFGNEENWKDDRVHSGDVPHYLGLLALMLVAAKLLGALAEHVGQPAVLGELIAGVLLGASALGLVDAKDEVLHVLSELGVVLLLFEIGLETELRKLLRVGGTASIVAVVGVVLPFVLGY